MIRILASIGFVLFPAVWLGAADATPTSEKIAESKKTAFAVEQRVSEKPIRLEQDCPSPEVIDVIKGSSWNTVELGVAIPLGTEGMTQVKPYSRYTCPAPRSVAP